MFIHVYRIIHSHIRTHIFKNLLFKKIKILFSLCISKSHILEGKLLSNGELLCGRGLHGGVTSLRLSEGFFVFVEDGNVAAVAVASYLLRWWRTPNGALWLRVDTSGGRGTHMAVCSGLAATGEAVKRGLEGRAEEERMMEVD